MRYKRFSGWSSVVLAAMGVVVVAPAAAAAGASAVMQSVRPDLWVPNGNVRASAVVGSTLYHGGDFDFVGPPTGHGVPLDRTTGTVAAGFPAGNGNVAAVVADGAGGGRPQALGLGADGRVLVATAGGVFESRDQVATVTKLA